MENNLLIWVNDKDEIIGYGEKIETHRIGQLHRAFSIFIFDREVKKMLIQKRSMQKYHSGGLWSNACCSHPYKNETWCEAIQRCMKKELGISLSFSECDIEALVPFSYLSNVVFTPIQYVGKLKYHSMYENMAEHEIDYVFLLVSNSSLRNSITYNEDEIEKIQWISLEELELWMLADSNDFTSWFSKAYGFVKQIIAMENQNSINGGSYEKSE